MTNEAGANVLNLKASSTSHSDFADIDHLINALHARLKPPSIFHLEELGIINEPPNFSPSSALSPFHHTPPYLGLKSWALNPLYKACKNHLRRHENNSNSNPSTTPSTLAVTTAMLFVNPDFTTAWNRRKELLLKQQQQENYDYELYFSKLVLTRSPKSQDAWSHRHWLLRHFYLTTSFHLQDELDLTFFTASRAFSNYYATVHRLRILKHLNLTQIRAQLDANRTWLRTHVRDSSGWTYHRLLLRVAADHHTIDTGEEIKWFEKMFQSYQTTSQNITFHAQWLAATFNIHVDNKITT